MNQPDDQRDAPLAVFRGSRAACLEASLVLESKGLPYELAELEGNWALMVPSDAAMPASDELSRYAMERSVARPRPPDFTPFDNSSIGAGIYASVLVLAAYCTGIQAFGRDWLEAGSLDARAGGGGEWWRAVTALTLHLDQAHLLGNLLFGAGIGFLAGRAFGPGVAWASILAAGGVANYLDMLISPSWHRAVGASTAVFAALGLLSGFAWRQRLSSRERFRYRWAPLFAGVCLLALLGAGDEHVDVLGHALGFAAGIALGWIYARNAIPRMRAGSLQIAAGAAALVVIVLAWILALIRFSGPHHPV